MDENIITSDKILKTMICLPTCIRTVDTIYWNGKHWLVPEWREDHTKRMRCPVRIIELDSLQPQPGVGEHHFQVQKTIPSDVFDGKSPDASTYNIVYDPDVWVYIQEPLN